MLIIQAKGQRVAAMQQKETSGWLHTYKSVSEQEATEMEPSDLYHHLKR